jgi:hypothetical protein
MKITTIGVDLAKNVLRMHGSDWHGKVVLHKQPDATRSRRSSRPFSRA